MDQLEQAKRAGLFGEVRKRSGLEIARDALAISHPGSPQLAYLDKLILKTQTLEAINSDKKDNNTMEDTTTPETPVTPAEGQKEVV